MRQTGSGVRRGRQAKGAKQLLDRPMAGLGIGVFMERDQVPVWVEDGELHGSPGLRGERRIRVNDGVACALGVQRLNPLTRTRQLVASAMRRSLHAQKWICTESLETMPYSP